MSSLFSGYRAASKRAAASIVMSATDVDEGTAAGTTIGILSSPFGTGWSFRLVDDADGTFALSGDRIVVGSTAPNHAASPAPKILVAATNGEAAAASLVQMNVRRRLATLPRPSGARIAAIGDSQIGYNNYPGNADATVAGKAASSFGYGFIEHALAIDPRFNFDTWFDAAEPFGRSLAGANHGIFGDHLAWAQNGGGILGRLPAVLARRPDLLILEGGTNSINSGDGTSAVPAGAGYCIAQLEACLRLCRNEGVPVILMTIYPRGDWPANDARYGALAAVNAWIVSRAGRDGIAGILDADAILAPGAVQDPSLFFADLVHPNHRGAYLIARDRLLPILRNAVAAGTTFDPDPAVSNLLPAASAKMQGTNGTKVGTGVVGDVAAGYTVTLTRNGSAIVCSKAIVAGDVEAQVLDVTSTSSSSPAYGELSLGLPNVGSGLPAAGQWVRACLYVETNEIEAVSFARLNVQLAQVSTVKAQTYAMGGFSGEFDKPLPANRGWWIVTKPMQIQSGEVFDRLRWTLQVYWPKTAATFRLKISRPLLRIVADPRPLWNY